MRQVVVFIASLLFLCNAVGHKKVAGSCFSPRSRHHGEPQEGNGTYLLTVRPKFEERHVKEVVFRLESEKGRMFRGFQIICKACEFLNLPKEDAQINLRHCAKDGRVSHTENSDKTFVEMEARLVPGNATRIAVMYFVVRTQEIWYGPMRLMLDTDGNVLPQKHSVEENLKETDSEPAKHLMNEEDDDDERDDDGGRYDDDGDDDDKRTSDSTSCTPSTEKNFTCMAKLKDYFVVHWTLTNATSRLLGTDAENVVKSRVEMLLVVETPGWASLSFAKIKGKMHPADAVLGWMYENGTKHIRSYSIVEDDVTNENEDPELFDIYSISREDSWLRIRFSRFAEMGNALENAEGGTFMNYATGKNNKLEEHDRWGSVEVNLRTGQTTEVTSLKFYQAHGSLMVIAWIILVPFSMTIARAKWSPSGMGLYGWLDLHKGLHLFAVIATVSALSIAVINFQPARTRTGRVHRLLGILVSVFFLVQIAVGFLRPGVTSPRRPLFSEAHAWGGRCLAVLACITVFLGISAFHGKVNSDPTPWIGVVLFLLALQVCTAMVFEFGPRRRASARTAVPEVGMTEIPYVPPATSGSDEQYTSD